MIIHDRNEFRTAIKNCLATVISSSVFHKHDAIFQIGDPLKGFYLRVDNDGWWQKLNGVSCCGQHRRASPLSNLQAAALPLE